VIAHDLPAHDAVQLMLQGRQLAGELLEARERDLAHLGVFQGDRVAGVVPAANRIQPQEISRHVEARYLLAAVVVQHAALHEAGPDGEKRGERLAGVIEARAAPKLAPVGDEPVHLLHLAGIKAGRQAQLTQAAGGAGDAQFVDIDQTRCTSASHVPQYAAGSDIGLDLHQHPTGGGCNTRS